MANSILKLTAILIMLAPTTVFAGTANDLDGDGKADILWRNSFTGQNWLYLMNGPLINSSIGINTVSDTNWKVVGNGDYNNDGNADILWRNSSTGQNWMYLMNSATISSSVVVNTVADAAWEVVGNGDYDGDGDADILWRNSSNGQNWMYLMNGSMIVSSVGVNTVTDLAWQVAGNGDFNGDGRSDILWRHSGTGLVWMYLMNGSTIDSSQRVASVLTLWQIAGNGDYNGDGKADILWRKNTTGQNWMYLMNGATISSSVGVNTVSDTNWRVVGSGDYNGDGNADILWRHSATGQNWMYLMNGATMSSSVGVNTVATVWDVIPRRTFAQEAYIKASDTQAGDEFGRDVALSGDSNTLAVGVPSWGTIYVYTRDSGSGWTQQAYGSASNTEAGDDFGRSVALSDDGNTLAVGAWQEDSAATGVNGDQANNSAEDAGAVYVYTRDTGGVWVQQAYVKASNTGIGDHFGEKIALSDDGNTLAVGADLEDSAATGVNGDQTDNSLTHAGAVYVYTRDSGGVWTQQAYVKASNTENDQFGRDVALSGDGHTLAVSATMEDSAATGVNGNQESNSVNGAGAVYVYTRDSGSVWTQQAYVKASNPDVFDHLGRDIALSDDGNTLAVSTPYEDSGATGVNGDQADNWVLASGAVYVYTRDSGSVWTQQAYVKASNTGSYDRFGASVALSDDGHTLAVGAGGEASAATGVNGDQADNSADDAGAVYVFTRDSGSGWTQQAYVKASNTDAGDQFGIRVALSDDGHTLAVSAYFEDSAATGVNGDQADNSADQAGAVYVFR